MSHTDDPRRYRLDYDWLWTNPPHNDGTPATVRLTLWDGDQSSARRSADAWLDSLTPIGSDARGRGGWTVEETEGVGAGIVLDITSAGEDVLEGLSAATSEAYEQLIRGTDLHASWEQLPRAGSEGDSDHRL